MPETPSPPATSPAALTARVEVFRPGTFRPMAGDPIRYSAADLRAIADAYDFATAPAPVVEAAPTTAPAPTPAVTADANGELQQVLDQNAQLRQALTVMQERETIYRQQLEQASQNITTLQAAQTQPAAPAWGGEEEDEEHEEHEEHERGTRLFGFGDHEEGENDHD